MIKGTFQFGSEIQNVIINGNELLFEQGGRLTFIEGLKLSRQGVIKEFPDLIDKEDWRKQAIDRLKNHIKTMKTEIEAMNYVKDELEKMGYQSLFYQKGGWRPQQFQ